jgi:hypothetical protein
MGNFALSAGLTAGKASWVGVVEPRPGNCGVLPFDFRGFGWHGEVAALAESAFPSLT